MTWSGEVMSLKGLLRFIVGEARSGVTGVRSSDLGEVKEAFADKGGVMCDATAPWARTWRAVMPDLRSRKRKEATRLMKPRMKIRMPAEMTMRQKARPRC